ncbi:Uncharacterized phage-encoded protein [Peptostreptococcus anaerobius]|uniref:Uncharacterized phage-encoded protein n=2 Tax=Peptostreptococcus anaerobius TaxID=1261 RepID=A0A379CDI9_9FIRM|nr:phage antirepressor KilAC domain-containing protein [Peptostreptococcus anaerobius]SFM87848.1 Prophage antirepressor [Peptostreptococcus anaerobius]SUB60194.1 Uncharacterized phage-encoded protein [Peptostreptococcus anaerobius]
MNNNLMIFENEEFGEVRSVLIDGEPWFAGKDVASILGYKKTANMGKLLDKDDFIEINPQSVGNTGLFQNGITQNITLESNPNIKRMLLINESGLYAAIFGSKLPNAKKFKKWVTSEVLPSIRKHGGYLTPDKVEEVLLNPDTIIKIAQNLKEEQEKRKQLEIENKELKPKATYCERVLMSNEAVTTTQISKDYGMTAQELNQILHEQNVQFKTGGQWLLYRQHQGKGLTESETYIDRYGKSYMSTKWTQKGRLFIYEILSNIGIYPNEEKEIKRPKKKQIKTGNKINYRDSLFDKLYNLYMAKQINKGQFAKCCSITTPTLNKMIKKYEENVGMN